MNALPEVLDFVASLCMQNGCGQNATLRARLVIEELFTNSVHHGYKNNSGSIRLTTSCENRRLAIAYQDETPPFNPFAMHEVTMRIIHANPDQRPVGGLGAILIANLADSFAYHYKNGRNIVELSFVDRSA